MLGPTPQERRKSPRVALRAVARLRTGQRRLRSRLVNVSLGGAMLKLERACVLAGQAGFLLIEFGRDPEEALVLPVVITGVAGTLVRVRWAHALAPLDLIKLRRLKERELPPVKTVNGRLPMVVWPSLLDRDPRR